MLLAAPEAAGFLRLKSLFTTPAQSALGPRVASERSPCGGARLDQTASLALCHATPP